MHHSVFTKKIKRKNSYGKVTVDKLVSVYDGDTFKVTINEWPAIIGENIGIRIAGIDAPEMSDNRPKIQKLAIQAKEFVALKLNEAGKIELFNLRRDKYFRIIADVYVDGEYLNDLLIEKNLAKVYEGGTKEKW